MVKYLVMDIDGTLTDGKIYMGPAGEAMKAFSVKDGYAINFILQPNGILPIVLTARESSIVQHRCTELGIKDVYQGKKDKLAVLAKIVGENELSSCAYFGDDVLDIKCMLPIKEAGGVIGCPSDAIMEVKAVADYVCINKAGEGALREFSEWLVHSIKDNYSLKNRVDAAVDFLKKINISAVDVNKKIVVNDRFFYSVQAYETKPAEECKLESHRKYVDIQLMLSGKEAMDVADIARLTVKEKYDEEKDIMFWNIPQRMIRTTLSAGDCIILYPENAHRGAVNVEQSEKVLKIVGKVQIM